MAESVTTDCRTFWHIRTPSSTVYIHCICTWLSHTWPKMGLEGCPGSVYGTVPLKEKVSILRPFTHLYVHLYHARTFYTKRTCVDAYVFTCMPVVRTRHILQRISRLRPCQLRCQACATAFIPIVVGLHLPFVIVCCIAVSFAVSLFVIVLVLSLSSPVRTDCSRVCPRQLKMISSDYVNQRIVFYHRLGKSFVQITGCLTEEGHATMKFTYISFRWVAPPYADVSS